MLSLLLSRWLVLLLFIVAKEVSRVYGCDVLGEVSNFEIGVSVEVERRRTARQTDYFANELHLVNHSLID